MIRVNLLPSTMKIILVMCLLTFLFLVYQGTQGWNKYSIEHIFSPNGWLHSFIVEEPLNKFPYGNTTQVFFGRYNDIETLIFSTNNKLVGEVSDFSASIEGLCIDTSNSNALTFLVSSWDGSNIPGGLVGLALVDGGMEARLVSSGWDFDQLEANYETLGIQCNGEMLRPGFLDEEYRDVSFSPCICELRLAQDYTDLARSLSYSLVTEDEDARTIRLIVGSDEFKTFQSVPFEISADIEDELLNETIDKLNSFTLREGLELNRYHSNKYELLQLVYTSSIYFESFASLLYREKGSGTWYQVDYGTVSSKAFHYPDDIEFIDDDQFETTICIEDCHWWGKHSTARINLRDRTITMSKNRSTVEEY